MEQEDSDDAAVDPLAVPALAPIRRPSQCRLRPRTGRWGVRGPVTGV